MFPECNNDESNFHQNMDEDDVYKKAISPKLQCMGKINQSGNTFHSEGYVGSTEFEALLDCKDPSHLLFSDEEIHLFGRCFLFDEAFLNETSLLLSFAKVMYERIEFAARGNHVHSPGIPPKIMREQLNEFLSYLRVYVNRFLSHMGREEELTILYEKLLSIIQQLTLFMNTVSSMPSIIFSGGSLNNDAPIAVFFHCYFDLRWSMIEMAYMAVHLRKYNESCRKWRDKFAEILVQLEEELCGDLLFLALRRFPEISPREWPGTSPFNCTCIRELWYMLLTLLMKTETPSTIYPFILKRFHNSLQESPSTLFFSTFAETKKLQMPSKDPVALIWLMTNLAKLSGFNRLGIWDKEYSRMEPNYELINKLVQQYFTGSDGGVTEERTAGLMGCLFSLSQIWGSNLNLCITLWEQFSRKLDEHFTPPSTFEPLPYSSCMSWFEHLTVNLEPWKKLSGRHNSYFIFLRLLGQHLEQMNVKNQSSLKARLYVKLQGKKFLELGPLGLYHILSACLTVTLSSDSPDMGSKILEISENHKQGYIFFVAEMVLLITSVIRGRDCQDVANAILSKLESATRSLNDTFNREEQRKYGTVFVEGFQEVLLHSKTFSLGQIKLIDKPLNSYLKNCGSCDRSSLIEALTNALKKLAINPANGEELYSAIMTHIFPLMKDKFASVEHVPFFVELTTAALEMSRSEFQTLFTFFCLDEKVNPRLSVKYLTQLLDNKQFPVSLSLILDNYQSTLIQTWFRISFLLPSNGEFKGEMERLNGFIRRLPRFAELTIQCSKLIQSSTPPEMILELLMMMSAHHQSVQSYNERAAVKEQYLQYIGPLDKYLSGSTGIANIWEPSDQVNHVVRLGSQLFFHCGIIIYTKGKADCLLALLNNILLTPLSFTDVNKELPTSVTSSFLHHLPLYVFGLFRLNPSRDPYILRCLGSVFQIYMTRYPANHSHPFTRCWTGLDSEPVTEALVPHVRTWFLQTFCNSVLPQKMARTSPYLQPALQWLKLLMANKDWKMDIIKSTILHVLELALILDEISSCKRSVSEYFQSILCGSDTEQLSTCEEALKEFVSRNMAFNSNRLFKVLETLTIMNADLVKRILPHLRDHVVITEAKRGTGVDSILRQHLGTLELALGFNIQSL